MNMGALLPGRAAKWRVCMLCALAPLLTLHAVAEPAAGIDKAAADFERALAGTR